MNIVINTKLFEISPNLVIAHIFNMLLFSQTNTYQQTYIAKHLGVTRMTVARALKWLKTEGYIDYKRNKYKEVITTKFTLTDKALQLKREIEKEDKTQTIQQQEKKENRQKQQQEKKEEKKETTQIDREQGDALKANPQCSNATKPTNTERTSIDDIVALRKQYEAKLKEKFLEQNGKNT